MPWNLCPGPGPNQSRKMQCLLAGFTLGKLLTHGSHQKRLTATVVLQNTLQEEKMYISETWTLVPVLCSLNP